jgi:hypothetical protein
MRVHFCGPFATTSYKTRQSSSAVQAPLTLKDLLSLRILFNDKEKSLALLNSRCSFGFIDLSADL